MALEPFIKKPVEPGEPVTAQAWNQIVEALAAVNSFLITTESSTVRVRIQNASVDLDRARVVAVSQSGERALAAVRPPGGDVFILAGLRPDVYTVSVQAAGFELKQTNVTVPTGEAVNVTLVPAGALMPDLFGQTLRESLADLKLRGINVSRVLDITGQDVPPANPGAEFEGSPVLLQLPAASDPVPTDGSAQLAIAASLQVEPSVEMPSLSGLNLSEARRALESIGLVLGKVETKSAD